LLYNLDHELNGLKSEWKDHLDELHLLFSIAKEICFTRNLDLLLDQLVSRTVQVLKAEAASLYLMNPDTVMLDFAIVKGHSSDALRNLDIHLRPGEGLAGWAAAHGKAILSNNPSGDPRFKREVDLMTGFQTKSVLAVPLISQGKTLGVIELINRLGEKGFAEYDMEFLGSIGWLATMALENVQAYEAMELSQQYLANILGSLPGGFIGVNMKNKITHCNARAMEILGLTDGVVGQRYTVALSGQAEMSQALEAAFTHGEGVKRQTLSAVTPYKGKRQLGYSTLLIRDKAGKTQGIGIQFQDITDFQ